MADPAGKRRLPFSRKNGTVALAPFQCAPLPPAQRAPTSSAIATLQSSSDKASAKLTAAILAKKKEDDEGNRASLIKMKLAVDRLVPLYLKKSWHSTATALELETGFSNSTLRRNAKKVATLLALAEFNKTTVAPSELDRAYGGVQGRRPRVSAEVADEFQRHIDASAASGDAVKKVGATRSVHLNPLFKPSVENAHSTVLESLVQKDWRSKNPDGCALLPPISKSSMYRAVRDTTKPEPVKADYNTKRRFEARADLGNAISLAAAWALLQRWAPGLGVLPDNIDPELCVNLDFSSVFLNDENKIDVIVGEDTAKHLKGVSASVKTAKLGERADGGYGNNNRSYGYATVTTMGGSLLMYIQLVKDTCYKGKEVTTVSVRASSPLTIRLKTYRLTD
jgi:hypothetical protein